MALRYFRFTVAPLSPFRSPPDDKVELRLQFHASGPGVQAGQDIWHRFADGEWWSVSDAALGVFGVHLDFLRDGDGVTPGALFFQEGTFDPPENPPVGVTALTSLLGNHSGPDNPAP
jgi:hypothetical protein